MPRMDYNDDDDDDDDDDDEEEEEPGLSLPEQEGPGSSDQPEGPDVDVDDLIEALEAVVQEAMDSDDDSALDMEIMMAALETRLSVPSGFLRAEFDEIIDDEIMRILDEDEAE